MTLKAITPRVYFGTKWSDSGYSSATIDALGEYYAVVMRAPKTGTIDRVHFRSGSVTSNGDGLRIRIETVDLTTGLPSGTLVSGSSEVTHTTTTANAWNRGPTGMAAAVTRGDLIAIKFASPGSGTTFNGVIQRRHGGSLFPITNSSGLTYPYGVDALPTATKASGMVGWALIALEYNDDTTPNIEGCTPVSSGTSTTFSSGSTPDERAARFSLPIPMRVTHLMAAVDSDGDFDLVLYDASSSVLASVSVDADADSSTSVHAHCHQLATPVELDANTVYRLAVKPTSATSITTMHSTLDTSTGGTRIREAYTGTDQNWKLSTRTDAGSWTDTDDAFMHVGVLADMLDDGRSPRALHQMYGG